MTDADHARMLDELDRVLNDPVIPMEPAKVWALLDKLTGDKLAGPDTTGQKTENISL